MKKYFNYILFLLPVFILLSGCQKYEVGKPLASTVANFTYSATNKSYAPCVVTFTNTSINAGGYFWDFGNGKTSTEANPTVAYDSVGFYTVTLTCTAVNDVYYNQLIKTQVINIKDPTAGLTQVLYYTSRTADGGVVHLVVLNDDAPVVQDFDPVPLSIPYGIAADTGHSKVYVSDYGLDVIYSFDADGKNPDTVLMGGLCIGPEALMVVGNKLYWGSEGGIYCCDLDGKNPKIYNSNIEFPIDMQYDPFRNAIYLVNDKDSYSGGYFSLNFDGTGLIEPIPDIDGTAIEANIQTGKVYFAGYASAGTLMPVNGIYMSNLDGSALTKIGDYGTRATWGIGIDNYRGKVFWGVKNDQKLQDGKIIRANLDGTGQEDWVTETNPNAMQVVWIKL